MGGVETVKGEEDLEGINVKDGVAFKAERRTTRHKAPVGKYESGYAHLG